MNKQKDHAGIPARSEKQIREELVRALEGLPKSQFTSSLAKEMMVAVMPPYGALIERQREEDGNITEVRTASLVVMAQMLTDLVIMTTEKDEITRKRVVLGMLDHVERMVIDAVEQITALPEKH